MHLCWFLWILAAVHLCWFLWMLFVLTVTYSGLVAAGHVVYLMHLCWMPCTSDGHPAPLLDTLHFGCTLCITAWCRILGAPIVNTMHLCWTDVSPAPLLDSVHLWWILCTTAGFCAPLLDVVHWVNHCRMWAPLLEALHFLWVVYFSSGCSSPMLQLIYRLYTDVCRYLYQYIS